MLCGFKRFPLYCTAARTDIYEGDPVFIKTERNIKSLQLDRLAEEIPNPSGGLEVKLNLTFTSEGPIMHMMRQFLRDSYSWDEEYYNFLNSIIFETRFIKFVLLFSKKIIFYAKKIKNLA